MASQQLSATNSWKISHDKHVKELWILIVGLERSTTNFQENFEFNCFPVRVGTQTPSLKLRAADTPQ